MILEKVCKRLNVRNAQPRIRSHIVYVVVESDTLVNIWFSEPDDKNRIGFQLTKTDFAELITKVIPEEVGEALICHVCKKQPVGTTCWICA